MTMTRLFCFGLLAMAMAMALGLAVPARASEPVADTKEPASAEPAVPKPVVLYGRLDLTYYRYVQDGISTRTWNLNGIRDTVLGLKTAEPEAGSGTVTPVATLELGFGADRGENGRDYRVSVSQAHAGLAGDWGTLTYGRQYTVMTNIAWSVLNPIAQGWGNYFNDLLYAGDTFTHGQRDEADIQAAGSDFFHGYARTGLVYRLQDESYTLEVDYAPGSDSRGKGKQLGLGGTFVNGGLTVAAAFARQHAANDNSHRDSHVLGAVFAIDERIHLHLARLMSKTSAGSRYTNLYGGATWQASDKLSVSASVSRYRQNAGSVYGAGRSLGFAAVLEYAITDNFAVYLEADRRTLRGADDGLQLALPDAVRTSNVMVGFYTSF